jgi:hypothetical protein
MWLVNGKKYRGVSIEEMFRDYKSGGYYLEGTGLKGQRLLALILLIALVSSSRVNASNF